MRWLVSWVEFECSKCGKAVKPGLKVGQAHGKAYCFRCGDNIQRSSGHKFIAKAIGSSIKHLRSI